MFAKIEFTHVTFKTAFGTIVPEEEAVINKEYTETALSRFLSVIIFRQANFTCPINYVAGSGKNTVSVEE